MAEKQISINSKLHETAIQPFHFWGCGSKCIITTAVDICNRCSMWHYMGRQEVPKMERLKLLREKALEQNLIEDSSN